MVRVAEAGLSVRDVTIERGGRAVIAGLNVHVPPGTALAVAGPNGAGKSTLLRAIAGLLPITRGAITLRPAVASGVEAAVAASTHYLGHADGLKLALSAHRNLAFYARWSGPAPMTSDAALDALGLATLADLPAGLLSAGQRRRLSMARLLVSARPLWLLDEPTTALDSAAEATLAGLMTRHLETGGLIVAATHAPLPFARTLTLNPP